MMNNQPRSNNNVHQQTTEYKITCAGVHCNNTPTNYLKLALIKKSGWFCESCKQDLQDDGLVESILEEVVVMGGESNIGEC